MDRPLTRGTARGGRTHRYPRHARRAHRLCQRTRADRDRSRGRRAHRRPTQHQPHGLGPTRRRLHFSLNRITVQAAIPVSAGERLSDASGGRAWSIRLIDQSIRRRSLYERGGGRSGGAAGILRGSVGPRALQRSMTTRCAWSRPPRVRCACTRRGRRVLPRARGHLPINLDTGEVALGSGQAYVLPRGVRHQPVSPTGAEVLVFEPSATVTTGDSPRELTPGRRSP